jgi:hypothetical protein
MLVSAAMRLDDFRHTVEFALQDVLEMRGSHGVPVLDAYAAGWCGREQDATLAAGRTCVRGRAGLASYRHKRIFLPAIWAWFWIRFSNRRIRP